MLGSSHLEVSLLSQRTTNAEIIGSPGPFVKLVWGQFEYILLQSCMSEYNNLLHVMSSMYLQHTHSIAKYQSRAFCVDPTSAYIVVFPILVFTQSCRVLYINTSISSMNVTSTLHCYTTHWAYCDNILCTP